MTADEEQLRKEANTFNTTVVQGSLLGAGLGILAGVLIGATTGRVENMVKYGAVGGVTGGVLGGVDGYMVAKQQEAGNNRIRMIQSMTRDVEADNEKLQALVESSNRILAELEEAVGRHQPAGRDEDRQCGGGAGDEEPRRTEPECHAVLARQLEETPGYVPEGRGADRR